MSQYRKNIAIFCLVAGIILGAGQPAFAQIPPSSIFVQQQIELLLQQIISLLKQIIQLKAAQIQQQVAGPPPSSQTATLTVNATGVITFVSINGATPFPYAGPINLNNGDKYTVAASSSENGGTSNTKCSGIAWGNGVYTCNISVH